MAQRIKYFLFFFLFLLVFVSCSTVKETNQAETLVYLSASKSHQVDTVLFQNGQTIILENTDASLLHDPRKVILKNDTFIIFDRSLFSVLFFDKSGKFINKIHHVGQGPGEYIKLYDVCLDTQNNCLALLVPYRKILYYSLSGVYLGEESLPSEILSALKIAIKDDWMYLIPADGYNQQDIEYSLYAFNRKTKEVKPIIKDKLFQDCWTFGSQFSLGDPLLFAQRFNNIVYELKGADFYPKYQFMLGDFNLPADLDRNDYPDKKLLKLCHEKGYVFSVAGLVESERGIWFDSNQSGFFYYNKKLHEIEHYESIVNSQNGFSFSTVLAIEGEPGKVAFVIRGDVITAMKEVLAKHPSDSEEYRQQLSLLDQIVEEDPNPVLFVYDLK